MAVIIPSITKAKQSKQPPTEGEMYLLEYLQNNFDSEAEVYFQPCFDGDRPDIVIIKKNVGVIIIEVKDWDLQHYYINSENQWKLAKNNATLKSPFAQAFAYKKHVFEIHSNCLYEKSLLSETFYGLIKVYVYFHNASKSGLENFYSKVLSDVQSQMKENSKFLQQKSISFEKYQKNAEFLSFRKRQFERDVSSVSITKDNLKKISFTANKDKLKFDDDAYQELMRLLVPPYHYANEGKELNYTKLQDRLAVSSLGGRAKISGIAGSGKTTVLAKRAVNAHIRHKKTVLILTYNLTLRMFIKDKINEVRENFSWSNFHITNYHKFMTIILNEHGVLVENQDSDEAWEYNYYSNASLFANLAIDEKYDTILIDEIQDYKSEWLRILRDNFLAPNGEMVLFGDEKQNIYGRLIDQEKKPVSIDGFGRWEKLSRSFRYKKDSHIQHLATVFQEQFLSEKYSSDIDESYQPALTLIGVNAFGYYSDQSSKSVAEIIITIAKLQKIHPNDITILSSREDTVQQIDFEIRNGASHRERTITSFASIEYVEKLKNKKLDADELKKNLRSANASKKQGFNLNSGLMKLCTTHSFKGFESPTVILFISDSDSPEIVYTGLTRAKENIIVFSTRNCKYASFFEGRLDSIEKTLPPSSNI